MTLMQLEQNLDDEFDDNENVLQKCSMHGKT